MLLYLQIDFSTGASVAITITGEFPANINTSSVTVTVGPAPCTITSATATTIACSLNDTVAAAGSFELKVQVSDWGLASGAPTVTVKALVLTQATPTTVYSGATAPMLTMVNVTGKVGINGIMRVW